MRTPATLWRRRPTSNVWHWMQNCFHWPKRGTKYLGHVGARRPSNGELCNQCLAKERQETGEAKHAG